MKFAGFYFTNNHVVTVGSSFCFYVIILEMLQEQKQDCLSPLCVVKTGRLLKKK